MGMLEKAREAEGEKRSHRKSSRKKREENWPRLPAIGKAAGVEVRRELIGQTRIVIRKTDRRKNGEEYEQHFGKTRIQVDLLRSAIQRS
jgi:hypothetical protein